MSVRERSLKLIILLSAIVALGAISTFAAVLIAGGSASATPNGPGWQQLDGGNSPYDYPGVAFTCHGPDGVYVTSFANSGATAGGGVAVVVNDPECSGR